MNSTFKNSVSERIRFKPHLTPIFSSTHSIPERLYEYDSSIFIVYNNDSNRFEIHSLDNEGDSYCAELPYRSLDARAERYVRKNDIRVHGEAIFKRIERSEQQSEKSKDRDRKNWIESLAKETQSEFAKSAWL